MKTLLATVVCALAFTANAKADDTPKLVGKWEITKSTGDTPVGAIVEFTKNGKLLVEIQLDGKEMKLEGTYKLDGKKLSVKLTLNEQKVEHDFTITLKDKDETLELKDKDDKVDTLKKKK
jgi:uncharacterized protein (TIGR03066 family)